MDPMPAMHTAFFWGHGAQVLFPDWPGDHAGVGRYLFCLLVVLALAALLEALSAASRRVSRRRPLTISALHAAKMGLAYLVMLAVMSFNVGVLLAAVAGHAVGFLLAARGDKPGNAAPAPAEADGPKP